MPLHPRSLFHFPVYLEITRRHCSFLTGALRQVSGCTVFVIGSWIFMTEEKQLCYSASHCSNRTNFVNGVRSEDMKQACSLLIRKLYLLMQNLGPLPNDISLTMKLLYYNDGRWIAVCAARGASLSISSCDNHEPHEINKPQKGEMAVRW